MTRNSGTFTPGDNHRRGTRGRPNPLNDPEFAQAVAEAFAAGETRESMCEMFGVKDPGTITRWRRDPRVKGRAFKVIEDRVLEITRKVDSSIQGRLQDPTKLTLQELLAIRKEFLGGALRSQHEQADDLTIGEAQDWLEEHPELADALDDMLSGKKPNPVIPSQD